MPKPEAQGLHSQIGRRCLEIEDLITADEPVSEFRSGLLGINVA
jgi:hypothetical protein